MGNVFALPLPAAIRYKEALRSYLHHHPTRALLTHHRKRQLLAQGNTIGEGAVLPSCPFLLLQGTGRDSTEPMEMLPAISSSWALVQDLNIPWVTFAGGRKSEVMPKESR